MPFIPFAVSAQSLIFPGIVLFGGIVAAVGVFLAAMEQSEVQRQLAAKNAEIAQKSEEIAQKSEEIADLNKRIAGLVTGGDGFCYLWLTNIDSRKNLATLSSFQQGEFPIYDVDARIVDLQHLKQKKPPFALDNFLAGQIFLNLGTMRVDGIKMLSSNFPLSQSEKRDFNVFFTARNGAYMQFLRLRRVQHEWRQATRVIVDEKVVFEKVDKGFPKDQLDWTSKETAEPILPSE
jgi:gas vesicle protein